MPETAEPSRELLQSEDYLVWSNEHRAWWKPGGHGYTRGLVEAGRFTRANALRICSDAIPSSAHVGSIAEIPVRLADVAEFIDAQIVPRCMMEHQYD